MLMTRLPSTALLTILLVTASGCDRAVPEPAQPAPARPAAVVPTAVKFACASGREVTVAYPDSASIRLTYLGQGYTLAQTPVATGARYAGADMIWTSSVDGGMETAVLARSGGPETPDGPVVERCARPVSEPAPVTDSARPGPDTGEPVPEQTPASVAPCKGPQLKLEDAGGDAGMGNRVAIIGVRNLGATACRLNGYPSISLVDDRNQPLATVKSDTRPGSYFRNGETSAPVVLPPRGQAWFDIAWNVVPHEADGETVCPTAARVRMTAPNDTSPVWLAHPMTPCGGVVHVTPFRSVAEPVPPAS